ncbi:MAG: NAD-dependent epimerase/dehydratase family protein [Rhodospirillales bacterium]
MRVLLLGATGTIGSAVLDSLRAGGHEVLALARSDEAKARVETAGAQALTGDLRDATAWAPAVRAVDAVVHAAATFSDDMGAVDLGVIQALIAAAGGSERKRRFLYTGGCWLYGQTGDRIAEETSPYDPLPAFAWMLENLALLRAADCFETILLHPAMVYERDGGVLNRFLDSARETGRIEVWGSQEVRWPLVHREDLAEAYRLALESGAAGETYCAAAEAGRPVSALVETLGRRLGLTHPPLVRPLAEVIAEQGAWAAGPALDQQMSGAKLRRTLGWRPVRTDALAEIA